MPPTGFEPEACGTNSLSLINQAALAEEGEEKGYLEPAPLPGSKYSWPPALPYEIKMLKGINNFIKGFREGGTVTSQQPKNYHHHH
ncbi:hypothetical protein CEXT_349051 [Caerostris extrusa]|uniref:Uncharacterized protein n=1 Tax=Caerostris extrusa TaxID=172846 RepID=A0AAV4XNU0_CAEEX|nr:hypothetical protein CEXT_349051 [Caerostris extrusa]